MRAEIAHTIRTNANIRRMQKFSMGCVLHVISFDSGPSDELAVVVTVTAKAVAFVPLTATELGETEHVDSASASVQSRLTVPLNPPAGEISRSYVAVCPAVTVADMEQFPPIGQFPPLAAEKEKVAWAAPGENFATNAPVVDEVAVG